MNGRSLAIAKTGETASSWLADGLDLFYADLRINLDVETLCTLGSELALFCWLVTNRYSGHIRLKSMIRIRERLKDLETHRIIKEIVLRQTHSAAVVFLLHELALQSNKQELYSEAKWLLSTNTLSFPSTPARKLELFYFLSQCMGIEDEQYIRTALHLESLWRNLRLEWIENRVIYELTHLIFYITDFGQSVFRYLTPEQRNMLTMKVETLMPLCIKNEHTDLIAELTLANWSLMGRACDHRGWKYLIEKVQVDGSIARGISANWQSFVATYHPTLIVAIAGLLY